ncbi:hypothetical protein NEFER03_0789 [Nematocida sp. LUAm3]|nr:hypothetical protein NEFER03_0789 [Nematocida sp. LUAm3]KAI5175248.1 hypothetical protein NEFER02_1209 [Nematocida sp. LUAm2]KAI5179389.1 hypothetical protein NEFER01_2220 [Nematocida sp. LUAm1]
MKLLMYVFGLFIYVVNVFAFLETQMPTEEAVDSEETKILALEQKHIYLIVVPVMSLKNENLITPNTRYRDIQIEEESFLISGIDNIVSHIEHSFMLHDSEIQMDASLMSIPEIKDHYKEYHKSIRDVYIYSLSQYKKTQQTFKEFLDNFMIQLINKKKVPQTYLKKRIEILSGLQHKVGLMEEETGAQKEFLSKEDKHLYAQKDNICDLLKLYNLIMDKKLIENAFQVQKDFAECVATRFAIESNFPSIVKQWLKENAEQKENIIILVKINSKSQKIYNSVKEKCSAVLGELIIYIPIHNKITYSWRKKDIFKKANEIFKNINGKVEKRKKKIQSYKTKKQKIAQEICKKELDENSVQTSALQTDNGLKNQDIDPTQLIFNSTNTLNPYRFNSRVSRWKSKNLNTIQESINRDHITEYHNQSPKNLLLAKHFHDIFPVIYIFVSEYKDEFFYWSSSNFSSKMGYLADGVMTISKHTEQAQEKIIKGQVEIGFNNYDENEIFHLYFKPLKKKDSPVANNRSAKDLEQHDNNNSSDEGFTLFGSSIYLAEFKQEENGDILIIFPELTLPGYPTVTKKLLLKKRKKNRILSKKQLQ